MAHTTTCPSCGTTFRVTADQLLARNGNVRCGRCSHVFNAHQSLSLDYPQPETEAPVEEPQPAAAEPDEMPEFATEEETPTDMEPSPEAEPQPEQESEPGFLAVDLEADPEAEVISEPMPKPEPESQPDSAIIEESPSKESVPEPNTEAAPEPEELPPTENVDDSEDTRTTFEEPAPYQAYEPAPPSAIRAMLAASAKSAPPQPEEAPAAAALPRRRSFRPLWLTGIMLLAFALLLQNILHFRNELIAQSPGLKPVFEQACGVFGCRVKLPQNADLLSIEASSLETIPTQPGIVVLHAALRNRAGYTQAYPLFELTLTDYQDKLVARRVFQPQEYLPPTAATQAGMPANEEVEVKLNIDLGDAKAAGYRVYLFYSATAN